MASTTEPKTPSALRNDERAVARHGAFGRAWLDGMWRGDPLADAVVDDGARLVRRALAHGVDALPDAPPALVSFAAYRAHDALVPDGRARRTSRAMRTRERELQRLRDSYAVSHDLVDEAA